MSILDATRIHTYNKSYRIVCVCIWGMACEKRRFSRNKARAQTMVRLGVCVTNQVACRFTRDVEVEREYVGPKLPLFSGLYYYNIFTVCTTYTSIAIAILKEHFVQLSRRDTPTLSLLVRPHLIPRSLQISNNLLSYDYILHGENFMAVSWVFYGHSGKEYGKVTYVLIFIRKHP